MHASRLLYIQGISNQSADLKGISWTEDLKGESIKGSLPKETDLEKATAQLIQLGYSCSLGKDSNQPCIIVESKAAEEKVSRDTKEMGARALAFIINDFPESLLKTRLDEDRNPLMFQFIPNAKIKNQPSIVVYELSYADDAPPGFSYVAYADKQGLKIENLHFDKLRTAHIGKKRPTALTSAFSNKRTLYTMSSWDEMAKTIMGLKAADLSEEKQKKERVGIVSTFFSGTPQIANIVESYCDRTFDSILIFCREFFHDQRNWTFGDYDKEYKEVNICFNQLVEIRNQLQLEKKPAPTLG